MASPVLTPLDGILSSAKPRPGTSLGGIGTPQRRCRLPRVIAGIGITIPPHF
ncbi:hypothetical protein HMPREF9080_01233 [Cardiobacterium valvarum F0432]|uniref:Uncharacterized protein n=1 Tax=Cardiobacterium valvarum F0432 TaxID=797473 RepID=G9ZEQ3_9GAMM|nr:hypothetical protein HMPREF9080_01233 [Cardiobacterium valvarum F0432]